MPETKQDTAPAEYALKLAADMTLGELADEKGTLEDALAPSTPLKTRLEKVDKEIRRRYAEHASNGEFRFDGDSYYVLVYARAIERKVGKLKQLARTLKELFWSKCSFSLKALEEAMPDEEQRSGYITEARTGPRKLDAVPKR